MGCHSIISWEHLRLVNTLLSMMSVLQKLIRRRLWKRFVCLVVVFQQVLSWRIPNLQFFWLSSISFDLKLLRQFGLRDDWFRLGAQHFSQADLSISMSSWCFYTFSMVGPPSQ